MSTIKVNSIKNTATNDGGIAIDNSGHVQIDGQQLPSAGALSNRNLVINGAMQVAQRSTSATGVTADGYYSVDRFKMEMNTIGTYTISQSTDAPDGFSNSLKYEVTTADASPAASDQVALEYRPEGQDLQHLNYGSSSAKSLTLSFWVKSDVTGTYSNELMQPDNSFKHYSFSYTINTADTWEHKTVTITGDASGVIDNNNEEGLLIKWWLGAGSNFTSGTYSTGSWAARTVANAVSSSSPNFASTVGNEWYITGVQLEVGSVATPFEHRSFSDELIRCQRYCYRVQGISADRKVIGMGLARDNDDIRCVVHLPTTMRANEQDVTESDLTCMYRTSSTNVSMTSSMNEGENAVALTLSADSGTPFTAGDSIILRVSDSDTAFFQVESEL